MTRHCHYNMQLATVMGTMTIDKGMCGQCAWINTNFAIIFGIKKPKQCIFLKKILLIKNRIF